MYLFLTTATAPCVRLLLPWPVVAWSFIKPVAIDGDIDVAISTPKILIAVSNLKNMSLPIIRAILPPISPSPTLPKVTHRAS